MTWNLIYYGIPWESQDCLNCPKDIVLNERKVLDINKMSNFSQHLNQRSMVKDCKYKQIYPIQGHSFLKNYTRG